MAPIFSCEICERVFSRKHHLPRHINIHVPNMDLKFSECCEQLSIKPSLKDDIQRVHLKIKMHKCEMCTCEFFHKKSFTNHVQNMHLEGKMHKCQMAFKTKNALSVPTTVMHILKNRFANSTTVKRHLAHRQASSDIQGRTQRKNHILAVSARKNSP